MLISLVLTFFSSLALAAQSEQTVDIHAWPLSASKSHSLAKISYNNANATIKSYTPPTIPSTDEILRIGFHRPSGSWSGVATAASNFQPGKDKKVQLHLNRAGELFHVGFVANDLPSSSKSGKGRQGKGGDAEDVLGVEVVRVQQGSGPHLNKPVVLDAEGKVPQKEAEKTFLQK